MPAIHRTLSRRDALKTLTAIGGAVTLSSLPNKWETPLVEVGALPAHAQVSGAVIAKIEDILAGDQQEDIFVWLVQISHNVPAGIAVDEDGLVTTMEAHFAFSGGSGGMAVLLLAGIMEGDEYSGTTLGLFLLAFGTNTHLTITLWLIDQNGEPTNRLTYKLTPSDAVVMPDAQKKLSRQADVLRKYKVKVVVTQ